jgi:hypothetical protein
MTYKKMQLEFQSCFSQVLTDDDINRKQSGIIGDESLELGTYVWSKDHNYIEYYVHWMPHYRGDSHGVIYKNGKHEHLETLPQIGKITPQELSLRRELVDKGLIYCPIISEETKEKPRGRS